MPLPVVSFSTYLTSTDGVAWRPDDYNAHDFILAIKDRDIAEYAFVRCRGMWRRFENANRQEVVRWFAEMASEYFERQPLRHPFVLVPVPGSNAHVGCRGVPRTATLANAIAALSPTPAVRDILRWDAPVVSSRLAAGTRDVASLYSRLRLIDSTRGERIVLVDDVLVLGGHLRACAAKLRAGGADVILALCAGRADQIPVADPFAMRCETLRDFDPCARKSRPDQR